MIYLLIFFALILFFTLIFNKRDKNIKIKIFKDFYAEIKLTLPKKKYEAGQFMVMDFIINNKKQALACCNYPLSDLKIIR